LKKKTQKRRPTVIQEIIFHLLDQLKSKINWLITIIPKAKQKGQKVQNEICNPMRYNSTPRAMETKSRIGKSI